MSERAALLLLLRLVSARIELISCGVRLLLHRKVFHGLNENDMIHGWNGMGLFLTFADDSGHSIAGL